MKKILSTRSAPGRHWVGDGFPVHGMFDYQSGAEERSPFLLLDYGAPTRFEPTSARRGVGQHPHRGFETVTIVYDGEVEHRDSTGRGGVIGKGDVQWMTAGAGILHEEFHSTNFARTGGPFEMVQLWVNLPAKDKMAAPGYQAITNADIPVVPLADASAAPAGQVRVIAGEFGAVRGPAQTFTPMNVWDVRVQAGRTVSLAQPEGWTSLLVVLDGTIEVNGETVLRPAQMATLSAQGREIRIEANGDAKLLLLSGEPIAEPVVGYGPFVMNSQAEIVQAFEDFNAGKFGRMQ
ncbi:pirin family protein [Ramlibacter sp. XY19]|uniref:pirin family protein n=1 Tax=Ramlibacter paludis TaxID=2908000 RepID=UPI0023DABDAC|nr:pirin family protein [Ramlibacter paludis]MCG2592228.1 pirin family protein [Ramlibacter paludis]